MKIDRAISEVRDAEVALARLLNALGERHKADHDIFHLTRTLQGLAHANLEALRPHAERHGVEIDPVDAPRERRGSLLDRARERTPELVGRHREAGLVLLRDLRELHLAYTEASLDYVILGQGAQAIRDRELLEACQRCHAQTLRGMKWTLTWIKTAAPQVLAS